MQIRFLVSAALALGISFSAPESRAQPWKPTRGVEIIVGSAPGGGAHLTGRLMQKLFQEKLITDVASSVVNKTGGGRYTLIICGRTGTSRMLLKAGKPSISVSFGFTGNTS